MDDLIGPFDNKVYLCSFTMIVLGRNETPGGRFGGHTGDSESILYVLKMAQADFLKSEPFPSFNTTVGEVMLPVLIITCLVVLHIAEIEKCIEIGKPI